MRIGSTSVGSLSLRPGLPRIKGWQWLTLVVAWLATMGVGFAGYERVAAPAEPLPTGQIVSVQQGSIAATISATGSIVATSNSKLTFGATGQIADILVNVGDGVQKGQPLARLDDTDLKLQVTQAQAQLTSAQSKLDLIKQGSRKEDVAAAQSSLASAKAKLAQLQAGPTASDVRAAQSAVAAAQSNLTAAQSKLATLQSQPNPDDVKAAQAQVDSAKSSLSSAQSNRNGICGHDANSNQCHAADAQVGSAWTALNSAQTNLDKVSQPASADDLKAAQQAVDSAKVAYDSAVANLQQVKAGASAADIAAAQSTVQAAATNLALKQAPYTDADLQGAQAAVDQAKAALALAQANLDNATILAPFAGNVAAISMNRGEVASASSSINLVDPKAVRIDTTVDESDVAKLELGQPAAITFDALPGQSYTGKVIAISPSGTVQSGVVTYLVSLSVDDPSGLKPGMTANANVEYLRKDNVLMVPNRAIRAQGLQRVVEVVGDSGNQTRPVQVGISNDQYTEITNGLQEGDKVLVAATTTATPRVGGGGPPGGGFVGPGGGGFGR